MPTVIPFTRTASIPVPVVRRALRYVQAQEEIAPPWLRNIYGRSWLQSFGELKDWMIWAAAAAVRIHAIRYADQDALTLLGLDRRLPQYPGEPQAAYRHRVQTAWTFWPMGGTRPGMLWALDAAGYRTELIEHGLPEPLGEDDPVGWAEFSINLYPGTAGFISREWGHATGTWGDGAAWGTTIAFDEYERIMWVVRKMKSAHSKLRTLRYVDVLHVWGAQDHDGTDANWGDPDRRWGMSKYLTIYPPADFGLAPGVTYAWGAVGIGYGQPGLQWAETGKIAFEQRIRQAAAMRERQKPYPKLKGGIYRAPRRD